MCTMALAGYLYPGAKRTLGACCAAAGISIEGWHSALADTRATAELFGQYLQAFPVTAAVAMGVRRGQPVAVAGVASERTFRRPCGRCMPVVGMAG